MVDELTQDFTQTVTTQTDYNLLYSPLLANVS